MSSPAASIHSGEPTVSVAQANLPVLDASMEESSGSAASFVDRQVQAEESLRSMQDTINQLTIELTILAARLSSPLSGDNLDDFQAEYLQKDSVLKAVIATKALIEKSNADSVKYARAVVDPKAPIKVSSVCPNNMPYLQWVGEVHEPNAHIFIDAAACLTRFQNVMYAHRLDFDTNYERLVLSQMSQAQLTWYEVEFHQNARAAGIASPTWLMFKNEFLSRFGTTVDEDRAACARSLVDIKLAKGESLFAFIDRFNDLRRRAVDQCLPASILVDKFLHALPTEFADKVITSRLSLPKDQKSNVDVVMRLARELYNDLYKEKGLPGVSASVSSASGSSSRVSNIPSAANYVHRESDKSRHAVPSSLGVASSAMSIGKVAKRPSSTASTGKYCSFHKVNTHDTANCKAISRASSVIANQQPLAAASGSLPSSSQVPINNRTCHSCGAPGWTRQHRCNTAVRNDPNQGPTHRFGMMSIAGAASRAFGSSGAIASSSASLAPASNLSTVAPAVTPFNSEVSSSSSAVPVQEHMNIDEHAAVQAQLCKSNIFSNLPKQRSNAILLPIVVQNIRVYAYLDTGCTFSICSPRFFRSLGVGFTPSSGTVQLGHVNTQQPRIGYTSLNILYNKIQLKHKFELFDFYTEDDSAPILFGLDIMPLLNIAITGLVSTWDDHTGPALPSPIDPEDIKPNNSPFGTADERQLMQSKLKPLLAANANIDLKNTYCNLPGAIVQLETQPGKVAYRKPYPIPIAYKQSVLDQIETWKNEGVIEVAQSHTGFNSPLLCVSKKNADGIYSFKKPRVVADVRELNSILISTDKYNIPLISDIHERLSNAKIITSIDIHSCFTSFLVDPAHKSKLNFMCPFTNLQYTFRKVCFGVSFIANLVQRTLTNLFSDLPYVTIYIDDICISTNDSLAHHTDCVAEVIRRLTNANLQLSPEKIVLAQKSIHILGWSIVDGKLMPDPRKVSNVHTWPLPQTGKDIMRYLGYFNYFRSAIPGYSRLAAPLDELRSSKSLAAIWSDKHTQAFRNLQAALSSALVLSPPDFRYRFHVATDASKTGIGGVIYYIKNDTVHYVTMASRKLSTSEMNYSTTKRELLAIVYMLTKYHKWLFGIKFTLHTDHKSLIFLHDQSTPNTLMLTWWDTIFSFTFDVVHIPGIKNIIPDTLSRLFSDDEPNSLEEGGNIVNHQNIFENHKKRYNTTRSERKLQIRYPTDKNKSRKRILSARNGTENKTRGNYAFSSFPTVSTNYDDNTNTSSNHIDSSNTTSFDSYNKTPLISRAMQYADYMTPPEKDRVSIIMKAHLLGHFGVNAIEKTIHNDYKLHWTNLRQDIQRVINDCEACQAHGIYRVGYHPPRSVLPDGVFDHICIDLGDFNTTSSRGNNFMLVVVDYFSRFTILRALPDKSSYSVAKELLHICCQFGFPRIITHDNGMEFVNEVVKQFIQMSGMDRRLSLPYTPTGNSVVESYVGICKRSIIKALTANAVEPESWDLYLDVIQYSVNCQYSRLHKSRPFAVMFNRQPNDFIDYTDVKPTINIEKSDSKLIDKKLKYVKDVIIPSIAKRIKETQLNDHLKFQKNNKIIETKYPLNSKVMIVNVLKSSKLQPRWLGPFIIKGYTKHGSYILEDLTGSLLSRDVPTHQIRLIQSGDQRSESELNEKHYEVQAIVNHRLLPDGEYEYYVHWVGYDDQEKYNTWQTVDTFDSKKPIQDYWTRRQATIASTTGRSLPNTINKRRIPARNKHSRSFVPKAYNTRS
jgi:transposase InsO family protein